jgi:hypothetical protein
MNKNLHGNSKAEKKEKEKAEREAVRKKGIEELRLWLIENASVPVKKLVEQNSDWIELGRNEWFHSKIPNGFQVIENYFSKQREDSPSDVDLALLKSAELVCDGNTIKDAALMHYEFESGRKIYGAKVTLFAPDLRTAVAVKIISEQN